MEFASYPSGNFCAGYHVSQAAEDTVGQFDPGADPLDFGIWSTGPVTAPGELAKVLREALKVVKDGKPAVVDVVCAMRP